MKNFTYEVVDAYVSRDGAKVVDVVVSLQGAEGPTEEKHTFSWHGAERYKESASGKRIPKTGADFKSEIGALLDAYYSPKA